MSEEAGALRRSRLIGTCVCVAVGVVLTLAVALVRGLSADAKANVCITALSDGCFVAGMLLTGAGALMWVSTTGFFDIFSYAFKSLLVLFTSLRNPRKHMHFIDYRQLREEKRGRARMEILFVGLGFIALSALCYVLIPAV